MGCCAVGTCEDASCWCQTPVPVPAACGLTAFDGDPCVLVVTHPEWQTCKSRKMLQPRDKAEDTTTRDGAPKLAAAKVHTEKSRKKNRQGPLYVAPDRRV